MTFNIPADCRVFVLDDTQDRLDWFRTRMPQMRCAKTSDQALEILSTEKFDMVFLDHDLSFMDAGFPERQHGNGKEVARYLARTGFAGKIVIHSKNEDGVRSMAKTLPQAEIARYESFEIVTASQARAAAAR